MITKNQLQDGTVKVTFSLEIDRPVSVVGDFNGWDPLAHPMVRRSNSKRSVAVAFPEGSKVCFRYLADGGDFFDDPSVDEIEPDGLGGTHSIVTVDLRDAEPSTFVPTVRWERAIVTMSASPPFSGPEDSVSDRPPVGSVESERGADQR